MKARIRAVLFDYGYTLVSFDFPRECLFEVLQRFAPRLEAELKVQLAEPHALMTQVLEKVEHDLSLVEGEDEIADYLAFYAQRWHDAGYGVSNELIYEILDDEQRCWDRAMKVTPGAHDVLERLRSRGVRTAIVSNAPFPPEMMRRQLQGRGFTERVETLVLSSEVGRRKPAPEMYMEALKRLDVRPEEALFVGDRLLEDYEGPRRLGIASVLYAPDQKPPAGVDFIRTIPEVEALV